VSYHEKLINFLKILFIASTQTGVLMSVIKLPTPDTQGHVPLEQTLKTRRSVRTYKNQPLSFKNISQLLWAAQGITNERGFRTAPSAGAKFPLEVYLVAWNIENIPAGIYHYSPQNHALTPISTSSESIEITPEELKEKLSKACLSQPCVTNSTGAIILSAVYERVTQKYGPKGEQYALIEIGCASQNIHLQAVSLNLGTVFVGGFNKQDIQKILALPQDNHPGCVMPVGIL
jgi:SagB-type dehydrogenase family enzyme